MISQPRFIPGRQLRGFPPSFPSHQPSSSDNREALGVDPQEGNYEVTVENGEVEE